MSTKMLLIHAWHTHAYFLKFKAYNILHLAARLPESTFNTNYLFALYFVANFKIEQYRNT